MKRSRRPRMGGGPVSPQGGGDGRLDEAVEAEPPGELRRRRGAADASASSDLSSGVSGGSRAAMTGPLGGMTCLQVLQQTMKAVPRAFASAWSRRPAGSPPRHAPRRGRRQKRRRHRRRAPAPGGGSSPGAGGGAAARGRAPAGAAVQWCASARMSPSGPGRGGRRARHRLGDQVMPALAAAGGDGAGAADQEPGLRPRVSAT